MLVEDWSNPSPDPCSRLEAAQQPPEPVLPARAVSQAGVASLGMFFFFFFNFLVSPVLCYIDVLAYVCIHGYVSRRTMAI